MKILFRMKKSENAFSNVYLAYDGSMNGDWVSRYAMTMAGHTSSQHLTVLTVGQQEGENEFGEKIRQLTREAAALNLTLDWRHEKTKAAVPNTLAAMMPPDPSTVVLCGARVKGGRKGFLAGTVPLALFEQNRHNILAIRVADPGQLGCPKSALIAMSGNPRLGLRVLPFLQLLHPPLEDLFLFRVTTLNTLAYYHLTPEKAEKLKSEAMAFLQAQAAQIREGLSPGPPKTDCFTDVSDDWPKDVLLAAGRLRARLLILGATEKTLPERFLYGNPLEQVLRGAPCDAAVFHRANT